MRSPCDPPKFDEKDWSQFDFSRWHAGGVSEEETDKRINDLASEFFQSEEWTQSFRSSLPEVQTAVRGTYEAELKLLRQEHQTAEQEFDTRIKAAERRAEQARQSGEGAAGPPILNARRETFQLAVRVVEENTKLGLPGTTVRLMDPRDPDKVLLEAGTDREGNALFSLDPEDAKELDTIHAGLQVVAPSGKTIVNLPAAVCVRLNGTETKIIAVRDSTDIEESKKAAAAAQTTRTEDQKHLLARVESLKVERVERIRDIDCRVKDLQTLIGQMQTQNTDPTPDTRPTPTPAPAPGTGGRTAPAPAPDPGIRAAEPAKDAEEEPPEPPAKTAKTTKNPPPPKKSDGKKR